MSIQSLVTFFLSVLEAHMGEHDVILLQANSSVGVLWTVGGIAGWTSLSVTRGKGHRDEDQPFSISTEDRASQDQQVSALI